MVFLESTITGLMETIGSNTIVNVILFIASIIVIKFLLKGVIHLILSAASGVIFLFVSNSFLGSSYSTSFETIIFFAAGGAIVYLAIIGIKHLIKLIKK